MEDLNDGVVIKMMKEIGTPNTLVVAEKNGKEDGLRIRRVKPVIWVLYGKWRDVPRIILNDYKLHGYYLVSMPWQIRRSVTINGETVRSGSCHVLHCVRNEYPNVKFGGKVGPLTSFVPRINENNVLICGNYVGYKWNGNESLEEIPKRFNGKISRNKQKPEIDANINPKITIRRLGVIIGKDGYCVGMEVRLSKGEEMAKRRTGEYHHTRPLLLENGFYVFDGYFTWQPIHSNLCEPIPFPCDLKSPLIFLSEGVHLIKSTKERITTNSPNGYVRNIEICPSLESEHVSIIDWEIFERDFIK